MPETITIGGKQYPKSYLYIGAAAVAGIVGYAWWTKGGGFGEEEPAPMFDEFGNPIAGPSPLATPPTVLDSNLDVDDRTGFVTNADWSQFAISHLQGLGLDAPTVASAIGKFLQRKPLSVLEADMVGQAVAVAGWPPEERPWTIIPVTGGDTIAVGLTAPANFVATGGVGVAHLSWSPVTGAVSYESRIKNMAWVNRGNVTSHTVPFPVGAKGSYTFEVRAVNSAGSQGPVSSASATVTATSGGTIATPTGLRVVSRNRNNTRIRVRWNAVSGAQKYYVSRGSGGHGVMITRPEHVFSGRGPIHVRAAKGRRPNEVLSANASLTI
jgi:hypothetical protein